MAFLSLHELPVDALWKRAALHGRRDWNMAIKLALRFSLYHVLIRWFQDTCTPMNPTLFDPISNAGLLPASD